MSNDKLSNEALKPPLSKTAVSRSTHCRRLDCESCKHYIKFLAIDTMHTVCWNRQNKFEQKKGL